MKFPIVRVLMILAGLYDGVLGAAFVFFTARTFDLIAVPPPAHLAYVHFAAALLIVFALMFWCVAADPIRYAPFISAGMGLKTAYIGTVAYYAMTEGVANVWLGFAVADGVWLVLFLVIWAALPRPAAAAAPRPDAPPAA